MRSSREKPSPKPGGISTGERGLKGTPLDNTPQEVLDIAGFWDDFDVIHSYTRAQAFEDGVLIDLTEWAKETGFRYPVAITVGAWEKTIKVPEGMESWGQSERGRAHDVLFMLYLAIRLEKGGRIIHYDLGVRNEPGEGDAETVTLKAICGPGDSGEPVVTILLPNED